MEVSALPPRGPGPAGQAGRAWKTRKAWEGLDAERPGLREEGPEVA